MPESTAESGVTLRRRRLPEGYGDRIRHLRLDLAMTLEEFAELIGKSRATCIRYEKEQTPPTLDLWRLLEAAQREPDRSRRIEVLKTGTGGGVEPRTAEVALGLGRVVVVNLRLDSGAYREFIRSGGLAGLLRDLPPEMGVRMQAEGRPTLDVR